MRTISLELNQQLFTFVFKSLGMKVSILSGYESGVVRILLVLWFGLTCSRTSFDQRAFCICSWNLGPHICETDASPGVEVASCATPSAPPVWFFQARLGGPQPACGSDPIGLRKQERLLPPRLLWLAGCVTRCCVTPRMLAILLWSLVFPFQFGPEQFAKECG